MIYRTQLKLNVRYRADAREDKNFAIEIVSLIYKLVYMCTYFAKFLFAIFRDPFLGVFFYSISECTCQDLTENFDREAIVMDERTLDLWFKSCS